MIKVKLIIYLFDIAFPLVHTFRKPALSLTNRMGRLSKITKEINANEYFVNLAIHHSDEAKGIIDSWMKIPIYNKLL